MMEKVQESFGWVASCSTMVSFITPVFLYLNVIRGRINYEDTPAIYVITVYINSCCWYIYGDMTFSDQVKYCYLIGSCMSLIYMVIYLAYEVKKFLIDTVLNTIILITGTLALYRSFTVIIDDDAITGKICDATACIVFLTPIQIIYKVIKNKNYNLISIWNCLLIILYSACWIVYGTMIIDYYIVFPNIIGIIISLIEIFIFLSYKKKYPVIGENIFSSTIGIENNVTEISNKKEDQPIKSEEEISDVSGKEKPVKIVTKN